MKVVPPQTNGPLRKILALMINLGSYKYMCKKTSFPERHKTPIQPHPGRTKNRRSSQDNKTKKDAIHKDLVP